MKSSEPKSEDLLLAQINAGHIKGLDFLRALSILLVIIGHRTEDRIAYLPALSGLGVSIFFVLSGFLITGLLLDEFQRSNTIELISFYKRRAARLLPAFYLYLLLAIVAIAIGNHAIPWPAIISSIFYVTNYYQAFTGAAANIVSHCWSLAVEEQFYVIWPLTLLLVLRFKARLLLILALLVLAVWCWRMWLATLSPPPIDYLYRSLETRGDALAIGALFAALIRSSDWRPKMAILINNLWLALILPIVLLLLNLLESNGVIFKYGICYAFESIVIALLLLITISHANKKNIAARILNQPVFVKMGQVSYGMYLFHGLIGYPVARYVELMGGNLILSVIISTGLIFGFSIFMYHLYELPAKEWILRKARNHSKVN
jgi:peptidoglycan/LPS O-acetylase OafA/YrhL